jgi:eukaryotic-like serine/threonine-protein kinase
MTPNRNDDPSGKTLRHRPEISLGGLDLGELFLRGLETVRFSGGGEAWVPPAVEELRAALPDFEVTAFIGNGGMGAVYRGVQRALDREVAIKLLRPNLMTEESALQRFINEARITAQLDHPNIPAVYLLESDQARLLSVFAMKMLEGETLENLLQENEQENRDGISAAIEVLLRICDALAFAHSKGVLHLDLKPSNVIVGTYGQIYLVDWGIARRMAAIPRVPDGNFIVEGTPAYMAPEQATGEQWKLDERTDIFALGGILYRILCGRAPHAAPTAEESLTLAANAEVTAPDATAAEMGRTLPRRLVSICMKALAFEPDNRYARVEDFQQDLERFARGLGQLPQRTFQAGEAIVTEGEPGDAAYVIVSGSCVATRQVRGETHELRRLGPGEMFGEAAVFTGQPRSATVSAITDTVVGVVEKAALREEMERTSYMSLAIRTVASTFLDLDRKLARQRQKSEAIELALRHVAFHGERGRTPWKPLLAMLTESTGASEAEVSSWVLDATGVALEGELFVVLR